ncbi:MAG TPA: hypothetical protein VMQ40_03590 [Acidimicrobiales bacterium]|jgi:hypothetical protein|nr:hypothetical protein [Acidimicrobiales bacterium]
MSERLMDRLASARASRGTAWLAVGIAVGLILAPAAAVAAGVGVTSLIGSNGTKAVVTGAGQLTTTPADVSRFRSFTDANLNSGGASGCQTLYTAPRGWTFVLTQITIDAWADPTPGAFNSTAIYMGTGCDRLIADWNPPTIGSFVFPFSPGIVVPRGHSIAAYVDGGVKAEAFGSGYLIPASDARIATPVTETPARAGSPSQLP